MKKLSDLAAAVTGSTTLAISAMAKQLREEGQDVIGFGAGEPDFNTPAPIAEAAVKAIYDGQTRYTPAAGIVPLRKAVCARLQADCGITYDHSQIVITSGAKHAVYLALQVLLNPGDEVILPAPYWVSYYEMIKLAGGVPVIVEGTEAADFKITAAQLEGAVTGRTKLLVLNNPSNPTGMLYAKDELEALCRVCTARDLYILSDEIYYRLVYGGKPFVSVPSLGGEIKARTILINGVSKSYAMTGWRIGYAAANHEIAAMISNYASHATGAPATIAQYAAVEALTGAQTPVEEMRDVFEKRRDDIVRRVNQIDGLSCITPDGAFYVMLNIQALAGKTLGGRMIQTGDDFAMALLEQAGVAVVPCGSFGAPGFVRLTYAASTEAIQEGLNRIESFVRGV